SHNERKVTCKHPVTGQPSQDNCIFVVNEQTAAAMSSEEKKERPVSMMCEGTNYNLASDYAAHPMSPVGRTSRSSKKVHNFGKRSNSIKRNPNAPVVRRGWLYKQDSTGMKLWKKRWFVLSDLCLFYYRDEKEEGILGSILLPSFQISGMSAEDHITRKFAFKAAHPNMRTYYFCTDTGKEMELWMKAMIDAALVQTEPVKRIERLTVENASPGEANSVSKQRVLMKAEAQRSKEGEQRRALEAERYGFQPGGKEKPLTKISSVRSWAGSSSSTPGGQGAVDGGGSRAPEEPVDGAEGERAVRRSSSMLQLQHWVRAHRGPGLDHAHAGPPWFQTLPRNMPSRRAPAQPRFPEGYRTLPRNSRARPDGPAMEEKRRSMRDDTMWQLYEWQQRHFYGRQGGLGEQPMAAMAASPSHGPLPAMAALSPQRHYRSELSSPVQRGDATLERRHRAHHAKHVYVPDRRSMPAGLTLQPVTPQSLQGKTLTQEECRGTLYKYRTEELDIDAKLSRLCEQDKVVQALEEKLQQLHQEKYTLEQALVSARQEIEQHGEQPAAIQSLLLQRDDLQDGLQGTCRQVCRATAELERAWREYDKLEYDVTVTRNHMQEQLDQLGEIQTESAGIQRAQIQKELWRIQDVMEGLLKHKQQRSSSEAGIMVSRTFSSIKYKNEGPDYRLYKSEPELTTVAEVDESNGEEKTEPLSESESSAKGSHFPVGVVPPRTKSPTPESSTIASYVTLRKSKKMDLRTERPRSAVEQLWLAEGPRPRMSLQEQMERMRRHQQACLRDRRKGLSILAAAEQAPSLGCSSARDNPLRLPQNRKRDDAAKESRENNLKQNNATPGEERAQLRKDGDEEHNSNFTQEVQNHSSACLAVTEYFETDTLQTSCKCCAFFFSSLQNVTTVANHKPKTSSEESEVLSVQEQEGIVSSFELPAQSSKGNQAAAVKSLPSSPESSLSAAAPSQAQLTEGSHFMCV
ncbi:PKHA5 protein, partial [Erithacus rubecula]|nr:PKHA5 protein [Erithacus rubecula]